ncbi:MAG: hypothetical protein KJO23_05435 [Bacteroidia bacterium]|nr:hypothetical protein [Bacteroidia bacterium]NNM23465.1 hypothetical protein [Flavobacteriaceae bacterium]
MYWCILIVLSVGIVSAFLGYYLGKANASAHDSKETSQNDSKKKSK